MRLPDPTRLPRWTLLLFATLLGAVVPGEAADGKVVTLPPFLVEETTRALPWRHADLAGFEVLSSCSERLTRELVANHRRLHALLAELVPPALQVSMTEKQLLFFMDSAHVPSTSQEVVAQLLLTTVDQRALDPTLEPLDDGRLRRRPAPPRYTFLPNLRLWDRDRQALFAIVREKEFDPRRVALTPDYVAYVLQNRTPALPPWYISGVLTLFGRATFSEEALTLERLDWVSTGGSAALLGGPSANQPLLPLADFFAGNLPPSAGSGASAELSLWQAQAALFVHWGLSGKGAPRRSALRSFVERAAVEPLTEALFRDCFGLSFAAAETELTHHLATAMRERLVLRLAERPRASDITVRSASEIDVARLKGDWERLEIAYVKAQFPTLTTRYVEQARRTLRRAYEAGNRDPQLLVVMGLCEADAGNDAAAREYLEDAARRNAPLRPRAWIELARLRLAELKAGTNSPRLSVEQAATVLTPLSQARTLNPPLVETYLLVAEVCDASSGPPARTDLDVLADGIRTFPRNAELIYRTAALNLRRGSKDEAAWQIKLGLTVAADDAARARFEALQTEMAQR